MSTIVTTIAEMKSEVPKECEKIGKRRIVPHTRLPLVKGKRQIRDGRQLRGVQRGWAGGLYRHLEG